jgi:hypothetical protein
MKKENIYEGNVEITESNQEEWNKKLAKVTGITGNLSVNSNVTLSCDALTSIGGYIYVYSNVTVNIKCLRKLNYRIFDNIAFLVESEKTSKGIKIYSGGNIISITKNKPSIAKCYVAEKDNFVAHGKTVKKSIQDLNFKIIAEKIKKDPIKKDTIISVQYYRIITGSCQQGCDNWMQQNNITKTEYKAKDLLPLLEKTNAWGLDSFKKLIDW